MFTSNLVTWRMQALMSDIRCHESADICHIGNTNSSWFKERKILNAHCLLVQTCKTLFSFPPLQRNTRVLALNNPTLGFLLLTCIRPISHWRLVHDTSYKSRLPVFFFGLRVTVKLMEKLLRKRSCLLGKGNRFDWHPSNLSTSYVCSGQMAG